MNRVDKHGAVCGSFRKELNLTHANNLTKETRKYEKTGDYSNKNKAHLSVWYGDDPMMSLKAYDTWIKKSRKRDQITYYRGYLVEPSIQPIAPTQDRKRVEKLQRFVFDSYLSNHVTLVQKKHGRFDYEYMAVRR